MFGEKPALRSCLVGCAALVLSMATAAMGGVGTLSGREAGCWGPNGYVLIAARVASVELDDKPTGRYHAVLELLVTVAGTFDVSAQAPLTVRFRAGVSGVSVRRAPSKGATVLAVIRLGVKREDGKEPANWVIPDTCTFMEGGSAMVEVDGLGDARVLETIETLRDRRAQSKPTTRPAGSK